jgi:hypothetical protein
LPYPYSDLVFFDAWISIFSHIPRKRKNNTAKIKELESLIHKLSTKPVSPPMASTPVDLGDPAVIAAFNTYNHVQTNFPKTARFPENNRSRSMDSQLALGLLSTLAFATVTGVNITIFDCKTPKAIDLLDTELPLLCQEQVAVQRIIKKYNFFLLRKNRMNIRRDMLVGLRLKQII